MKNNIKVRDVFVTRNGEVDAAIAEYRQVLRLMPDDSCAHHRLGMALRDKGELDAAVTEYREALRLEPDDPDAHGNLGNALGEKGDLEGAIAEYREVLRLRPDDSNAHYNLGITLSKQGELDAAVVEYLEALRLKLDEPEVHYNLGNALREKWLPSRREAKGSSRMLFDLEMAYEELASAIADYPQAPELREGRKSRTPGWPKCYMKFGIPNNDTNKVSGDEQRAIDFTADQAETRSR